MWQGSHMSNVISVRGLKKSYGSTQAVAGIDLTIAQGEIFALLGPNGAGKTTTVEILEGFRTRDSGEVSVLDTDPSIKGSAGRNWRNRIGIVLQSTSDAGDLSVQETIAHFANYYANPRDVDEVVAAVGLSEKSKELIRTLSGGQRRRLDVALGIIGSPELLFLDEPTTGFDPKARRAFWALIKDLIEISTPALLGGRATSLATVSWLSASGPKSEKTDNPTALISKLSADFPGEIPELTVKRASLEDIYLEMIGGEDESE